MRHGFGATTYTCSASGRWARTACAPRPTRTIRPCAAASAITRSVSWTIAASSGSTRGTPAVAMNISGDPAARVRARRSTSPGARSSRWATASGGSPARRATSSTNSLSITSHPSSAATRRAPSEPPEAYWRVIVMTGGAISGLQVLAQLADVEQWQPALGRHEDDEVVRGPHVVQHLDPLLGERFGRERLVQEPLLLGLQPRYFHAVPLGLDLLLLGDLVVDRLYHLGGRLEVAQEERGDGGDPELAAAGARRGHEGRVDQGLHGVGDLRALGDVVDRVLHHAVAHPFANGVKHRATDLVLVADLGEDLGRLLRVDLPADRHFDVHAHLLARERLDRLDLLAARGPLLFARRVALDRGPRRHEADAGEQRSRVHVAEGVTHPDFTRVDHDQARPGGQQDREKADRVAAEAQQGGDVARALDAHGGRSEEERKRDDEQDAAADELAHGRSERGDAEKIRRPETERLLEEVRASPSAAGLAVPRPLRLRARAHVAELLVARDPLLGHQPLEHQLACRDHGARVLLGRETHLVHQVEQARDDAEALEAGLGALVHGDLERPAFVEPVDDVVHVGAAHAGLERLAGGAPAQVLGDRFRALQLGLVLELQPTRDC